MDAPGLENSREPIPQSHVLTFNVHSRAPGMPAFPIASVRILTGASMRTRVSVAVATVVVVALSLALLGRSGCSRADSSAGSVVVSSSGIDGLKYGASKRDCIERLGEPSAETNVSLTYSNRGLSLHFARDRLIAIQAYSVYSSLLARSFAGSTDRGIKIGSSRREVIEAYGLPASMTADEIEYATPEMTFHMLNDKVANIWIKLDRSANAAARPEQEAGK
jgi:hypothetical protein